MRLPRSPRVLATCAALLPAFCLAEPAAPPKPDDRVPAPLAASDSPEQAMKNFTVAPGLQVDLWAAEPLLANPVAFAFDDQGRAWVAETNRRRSSVPDIRRNADWVIPNLALRSAEERDAFLKKKYAIEAAAKPTKDLPDRNADGQFDWRDLAVESEQIRLLEDRNGDGKAELSSVFADGFNQPGTGIAAGVLARAGNVWATIAPDLWLLKTGPDGKVSERKSLLKGFGVHVVYSGHDMHGLKLGPDGKLYWSIADAGSHVVSPDGRKIDLPDTGAVFRANPDGTEVEVVATGLRNPQSLAFNDLGDLFTGDNNADGGDKARWLHLVDGADYGWRLGWQFLPKLGAWNSERLWELDTAGTALSLLPPVGHIGHGPAGIAYYPGTGLPEQYREHFFYADFPGGVRAFAIQPRGASYTVEDPKDVLQDNTPGQMTGKLLWNLYPSDVAFSTDGGAYVLDWLQGWEKTGKGRIYRVHDPKIDASPLVQETKRLLAEGFAKRLDDELARLLGHQDQRVRIGAQTALAARGPAGVNVFMRVARVDSDDGQARRDLARLHALWGLGMMARQSPETISGVLAFLRDKDPEVRAQAAKVLGDAKWKAASRGLLQNLADPSARVRFFAAQALGKIGGAQPVSALVKMLQTLPPEMASDAFLRHGAVMALATCATAESLAALAKEPSSAVRAAALLALRRQGSPLVASFLADADPVLAREAARAIHDARIPAALPQLAALTLASRDWPEKVATPIARRVINAGYLLGSSDDAKRLAELCAEAGANVSTRLDALEALGQWNTDLGRDRITGLYQPVAAAREPTAASAALLPVLESLLKDGEARIRLGALEAAGSLKLAASEPLLLQVAQQEKDGNVRAAALRALASVGSPNLRAALTAALESKDKPVLEEARKLTARLFPANAAEDAAKLLATGSIAEQQAALKTLGQATGDAAAKLLAQWLDQLNAGKVAPALQLDLLQAAAQRNDPALAQKIASFETTRNAADPVARWSECLEGGNAAAGREIFREKAEVACMRCHKVKGEGGDVGPDLAGLGSKQDRKALLSSIVNPNAAISPGYENVMLTLKDGSFAVGILSAENESVITLTQLADGTKVQIPKDTVTQRDRVPSAMPEGLGEVLGKQGLRDVVDYLATLK